MKTVILKNTIFDGVPISMGMAHGWGNGYVLIPKEHALHGKDYDELNKFIDIHGGLTFSKSANVIDSKVWINKDKDLEEEYKDAWMIGFDTAHFGDNEDKWSKHAVQDEADNLMKQLMNYKSEESINK